MSQLKRIERDELEKILTDGIRRTRKRKENKMAVRLTNRDLKKLSPAVRKQMGAKVSKYNAERSGKYASKKEEKVAIDLALQERCGRIFQLKEQVRFEIVTSRDGSRPLHYIADFTYYDKFGKLHVVDAKGVQTQVYKLKKALMWERHGIKIVEV